MNCDPSVNIILAPWSSGSTSVSGYLHRLGYCVPEPHVATNDERTSNSFEPRELMQILASHVDEMSLRVKSEDLEQEFGKTCLPWIKTQIDSARQNRVRGITLKHPLLAFHINSLARVPNVKFVVVMRDLEDIEKTRQRRKWAPVYGQAGAVQIYNKIFSAMLSARKSFFCVHYDEFKTSTAIREKLRAFVGKPDTPFDLVQTAEGWVRK